jgi:hypothetical protein
MTAQLLVTGQEHIRARRTFIETCDAPHSFVPVSRCSILCTAHVARFSQQLDRLDWLVLQQLMRCRVVDVVITARRLSLSCQPLTVVLRFASLSFVASCPPRCALLAGRSQFGG